MNGAGNDSIKIGPFDLKSLPHKAFNDRSLNGVLSGETKE